MGGYVPAIGGIAPATPRGRGGLDLSFGIRESVIDRLEVDAAVWTGDAPDDVEERTIRSVGRPREDELSFLLQRRFLFRGDAQSGAEVRFRPRRPLRENFGAKRFDFEHRSLSERTIGNDDRRSVCANDAATRRTDADTAAAVGRHVLALLESGDVSPRITDGDQQAIVDRRQQFTAEGAVIAGGERHHNAVAGVDDEHIRARRQRAGCRAHSDDAPAVWHRENDFFRIVRGWRVGLRCECDRCKSDQPSIDISQSVNRERVRLSGDKRRRRHDGERAAAARVNVSCGHQLAAASPELHRRDVSRSRIERRARGDLDLHRDGHANGAVRRRDRRGCCRRREPERNCRGLSGNDAGRR